ncbi:MAG: Zn-dependent hydrolase [Cellvibrio sp.]|jgi:L-ascorbate metabolism protein UlaG (beta-lactamase superfamily)|nr:Zn-dependent hydrolase [Cellvibrio sp.]
MNITQVRNATVVIQIGQTVVLVDPMLAPKGAIPALKYFGVERRRNPLVDLPENADSLLEQVTHCLITHCQKGHFDHLDRRAIKWLRERNIPVFCAEGDAGFLQQKGLLVIALNPERCSAFLSGQIQLIPCLHGRGLIGKMMAHGVGYFIQLPDEPSLYIAGDTLLTDEVRQCIALNQPDITLIPAGGARFDLGGDIIMGVDEAIAVGELTGKQVIANHLEALDHCPVSRVQLQAEVNRRQWQERFFIPADGETLTFGAHQSEAVQVMSGPDSYIADPA